MRIEYDNAFDDGDGEECAEGWRGEWNDMPEFAQEQQESYAKIVFRFENEEDLQEFSKLIDQQLTRKTKSAWYPYKSHWRDSDYRWKSES